MYDVIVVGASVAGSPTAYRLAEKGYSVLLLDKEKFPRDKPCGDGLSYTTIQNLPYPIPDELLYEAGRKVAFIGPNNDVIRLHDEKTAVYTCPRVTFDEYLLRKAKKIGVDCQEGSRMLDIYASKGRTIIQTTTGNYEGRVIIGADGFSSTINKKMNIQPSLKNDPQQYRVAIRGYLHDKSLLLSDDMLEFYMSPILKYGYGWLFPIKNGVNIGIGALKVPGQSMRKEFNSFCQKVYQLRGREYQEGEISNIKGHYLPVAGYTDIFAKENVLLIGDAARLVDGFSGEGMKWAVMSGKIAAETIHMGFTKGFDISSRYNKQIKTKIHKNLVFGRKAGYNLYKNVNLFFTLLKYNPSFAQIFYSLISGEVNYKYVMRRYYFIASKLLLNLIIAKIRNFKPADSFYHPNITDLFNVRQ